MTTPLFEGVPPDVQMGHINLILAISDAAAAAAQAGLPHDAIALMLAAKAHEVASIGSLVRLVDDLTIKTLSHEELDAWATKSTMGSVSPPAAEEKPATLKAEKPDPTKWFDLEGAPKDSRLVVLAPRAHDSMPPLSQWIGSSGVVARWSPDLGVWVVSLVDASEGGHFEDDYFFAYRPLRPEEFTGIENVAASHPPAEPIETIGAELSLHLPEWVTIRSTLLTDAERAQLLDMMQEADKRGRQPLGEWLAANPVD